jgi:hypothetical protein
MTQADLLPEREKPLRREVNECVGPRCEKEWKNVLQSSADDEAHDKRIDGSLIDNDQQETRCFQGTLLE